MKKKLILLLPLFLLIWNVTRGQEDPQPLEWFRDESAKALAANNYRQALDLLNRGKKLYPQSQELNKDTGAVYFEKELYSLALKEYLIADRKAPGDFAIMDRVQLCYSFLNREQEAVKILEEMLGLFLESTNGYNSLVTDLGWLYFKTSEYTKGVELLEQFLEKIPGTRRSFYIILGTLYSGLYDYANSKKNYTLAINEAEAEEDWLFAAVTYYNLSLLERGFFHYDEALAFNKASLDSADRTSGHLALSELYLTRMEFKQAEMEIRTAYLSDDSPLSKISMAELYIRSGYPEKARLYLESLKEEQDMAWLFGFGTSEEGYKRDIHDLYARVYNALSRQKKLLPPENFKENITTPFLTLIYDLKAWYHRQVYRSFELKQGKKLQKLNVTVDANKSLYNGMEGYPGRAIKFLQKARNTELPLNPGARPHYQVEEGILTKESSLIRLGIESFDADWEREGIYKGLSGLIPLTEGTDRLKLINRAYQLNPRGILSLGTGLPLILQIHAEKKTRKKLIKHLKKAGSRVSETGGEGFIYLLEINWGDMPSFRFLKDGVLQKEGIITLSGPEKDKTAFFIKQLLTGYIYAQ